MEDCVFCKIVQGTIPATVSYEDDIVVGFLDIHPVAPGHTILIPKKHFRWFQDLPDDISDHLFRITKQLARTLKKETSADYIHLSIVGKDVPHVHAHLIPRNFSEHVEAA